MERRVLLFLISAIFLYLAGVMTGAYLGSIRAIDITSPLKLKTLELERKVTELESRLDAVMSRLFLLQMVSDRNVACAIVEETLNPLLSEISSMVRILPPRLEEAEIPVDLENRYSSLNVKAFVAADYIYRNCGGRLLPALYIYEHGDVNAGKLVDAYREEYNTLIFVAWAGSDDSFIRALNPQRASLYVCGELVDVEGAGEVFERCSGRSSS